MNTTIRIISTLSMIALLAIFASCKKDDPTPKPTITLTELGEGEEDNRTVTAGEEMHVEAEVVAEGKIDKIIVRLHLESGTGNEINIEYLEFKDLKNTTFHKHIDIPVDFTPGAYHFDITVRDQQGYEAEAEGEITVVKP